MLETKPFARLDDEIAGLRKQLAKAEKIRELLGDDPEIAVLLRRALGDESRAEANGTGEAGHAPKSSSKTKAESRGGTAATDHFRQIVAYFEREGDEFRPLKLIQRGAGLARSAVVHTLYRTHHDLFEKMDDTKNKLWKLWKLRADWKERL